VRRGIVYGDLGQWEKASADFEQAAECKHKAAWYYKALLCLRDGNLDGYRKVCVDMLQRFGKADDPASADWPSLTCVLAPNAGVDPAQLVSLAERASGQSPKDHWNVNRLGVAL